MALENKEVPSTSNSSYCDDDVLDYYDDDESSIMSNLVLKYENFISKKVLQERTFKTVKRI